MPPELLPTPDQMARADLAAAALGVPAAGLMEAAGRAVARAAIRRWRPRRTLVLTGPGNNGGDGWVAARLLSQAGWPVAVAPLAPPRPGSAAAAMAARWHGPVRPFAPAEAARAALVIDALFGAGLSRPLDPTAEAVLAAAGGAVLAVDVPSGLDGATGRPLSRVRGADLTVTFARRKPGHLLLPGRDLCGTIEVAPIGLPDAALEGLGIAAFANAPALWGAALAATRPGAASHKHRRGHVAVAAGSTMPGASRLALSAARRAGAGMATLAPLGQGTAWLLRQAGQAGDIVADAPPEALLSDGRARAWVLGPGLLPDPRTLALLRAVLDADGEAVRGTVVDAGALSVCAGRPELLRGAAILTPHAGEFARVFGEPGADRLAAARDAAARTGAVVLLKGSDTVIAAPDGRAAINEHAPPGLATAGTGDVLSGVAAAFLAGGMPPFEAACAAAWVHAAACPCGPGAIAEDVIEGLPGALHAALAGEPSSR